MTHPSPEFLDLQAALAGEYSLQRELGRGGMGVVYLARDVQLDRDVAIKVLPTHLARDPEARERFVREARMAAGLSHPHIVPIHRVSEVPAGHPEGSEGPRFEVQRFLRNDAASIATARFLALRAARIDRGESRWSRCPQRQALRSPSSAGTGQSIPKSCR